MLRLTLVAIAWCQWVTVGSAQSTNTSSAAPLPTVDLGYAVQQATLNASANPYYNFSNIRYGQAPVGNLRFAAPLAPTAINRTLNDGQQSVICHQAQAGWLATAAQFLSGVSPAALANQTSPTANLSLASIPPPSPLASEDCLFLDVMVPKAIFDKRRVGSFGHSRGAPVMVWIYGGGYTGGSKAGSGSPASLLARSQDSNATGVIYVAMNYRLGLFGWLSGPTFQANGTGNAGLYDQELALKWVQTNIALFGGDPSSVTVFGESAGGGSIMHQITAYGGLKGPVPFQQAIPQSPGFLPMPSNGQQEAIYLKTLQFATLISGQSITTTQQLRNLTQLQLYQTNAAVVGLSTYGSFTYGPAVDGLFVPKLPGELLLHGQFDKTLNVMLGHNLNEGLLFTSPFVQNNTQFLTYLALSFPDLSPTVLTYITTVLYPPIFNGSYGYTNQIDRSALLLSEVSFTCNTRYLDLAYANTTYSYYFTVPPGLHGEDIGYTYFNGDNTTSNEGYPTNATVAMALQDYLTSFAMTGNPNGNSLPYFPAYGSNSSTTNLGITNLGGAVVDTVANARCDWWQKGLFY